MWHQTPTSRTPRRYIQADKENEIHVEALYADLQRRFTTLKSEWSRGETERIAMRRALKTAQATAAAEVEQNRRLQALMQEVHEEQSRMSQSKATILRALGLDSQNATATALSGAAHA